MPQPVSLRTRRQGELRARYRTDPAQALILKHATTVWSDTSDAVHGTVVPGKIYDVAWDFGVDRAVGGEHDAPNPGDMMCAALAACQHATLRMIAESLGVALEHLDVEVIGHVDVRGCLGVGSEARVGFTRFECRVQMVVARETDARLCAKLRAEAERSCINVATLRSGVPIQHTWKESVAEAV